MPSAFDLGISPAELAIRQSSELTETSITPIRSDFSIQTPIAQSSKSASRRSVPVLHGGLLAANPLYRDAARTTRIVWLDSHRVLPGGDVSV